MIDGQTAARAYLRFIAIGRSINNPVEIIALCNGCKVTASFILALMSIPAAPAVA